MKTQTYTLLACLLQAASLLGSFDQTFTQLGQQQEPRVSYHTMSEAQQRRLLHQYVEDYYARQDTQVVACLPYGQEPYFDVDDDLCISDRMLTQLNALDQSNPSTKVLYDLVHEHAYARSIIMDMAGGISKDTGKLSLVSGLISVGTGIGGISSVVHLVRNIGNSYLESFSAAGFGFVSVLTGITSVVSCIYGIKNLREYLQRTETVDADLARTVSFRPQIFQQYLELSGVVCPERVERYKQFYAQAHDYHTETV